MIDVLFGGRLRPGLILIALVLIIGLNIVENPIRRSVYNTLAPVQLFLWKVGDATSDSGEEIFRAASIKAENESLLLENMSLVQELAELQDIAKENEELRKTLDFALREDVSFVSGKVVWKDLTEDVLILQTEDGVEKGMPVVTPEKIAVGRVEEVLDGFSRVRLFSNTQSSLDVAVGEQGIGGVAKGQGKFRIGVELLPHGAEIQEGDLVVTSQLGGIFPKNFLIGTITEVMKSDLEPFQQARISPFFDISLHRTLLIITNYISPEIP